MDRSLQDGGGRTLLDDAAGVHHGDPVRPPRDQAEVVRDDEQPGTPLLRRPQLLHHAEGDAGVEGRGRFVRHEQPGAADRRGGDEGTLSHPAGQGARGTAVGGECGVESDGLQFGTHRLDALTCRQVGVQAEGVGDLAPDRTQRVQGAQGLLSDVPDVSSADRAPPAFRQAADVLVGDGEPLGGDDSPAGGQTERGPDRDGLAGAGGADEGDALARRDPEGDVGDDGDAVDRDREPDDLEGGAVAAHRAAPARRRARPSTVTAVARTTIARPGNVLIHGAVAR